MKFENSKKEQKKFFPPAEQKNGCYGRRDALYTKRDPVSGLFATDYWSLQINVILNRFLWYRWFTVLQMFGQALGMELS